MLLKYVLYPSLTVPVEPVKKLQDEGQIAFVEVYTAENPFPVLLMFALKLTFITPVSDVKELGRTVPLTGLPGRSDAGEQLESKHEYTWMRSRHACVPITVKRRVTDTAVGGAMIQKQPKAPE